MTEVSLKDHLESQIKWLDRHFDGQIKAIDVSTVKALAQLDKRLEGMNEFRDSLKDQSARFVTRSESEAMHVGIEARMKSMEISRASGEGKMLMISGFVAFVASILVGVISHWVTK